MEQTASPTIINKIELFDFLRVFMTDKITYEKLTHKAKADHMFMTMRTLSIAYPVQMHALNKVHSVALLDALHKMLCKHGSRQPAWMFTKTEKAQKVTGVLAEFDRWVIDKANEIYDWEWKTMLWLNTFDPEMLKKKLEYIVELYSEDKGKVKKRKGKSAS